MKKIVNLIAAFLLILPAAAQISTDEQPVSYNPTVNRALKNIQTDVKTMPNLNRGQIQQEDERDEQNGLPPRFGFPHKVEFNLDNSGVWTTLPDSGRIWQLHIHCPGALSINLLYDQFWLPEGAKLFLYTSDRKHSIGAFTSVNNKGTATEVKGFATGLLYGETITLEYYLPKDVKEQGIIAIAHVVHGYRYINLPEFSARNFGTSGDCQVNVNCAEGANWQQEKNAVALILVGGTRLCTGSLINTTCNDDRPLFLTADHCLQEFGADAITNPNLNNWSFYWHYESPSCTNPVSEPPVLSTVGATVLANNGSSDFALLQLVEDPKDRNGVTPYYLGWDRSGVAGTSGVGIHHPSGDVKKIATYTMTPPNSDCFDIFFNGIFLPNDNFWRINWVSTANGHSVTEGGSSGSPLINSNRRVIGQLFGAGACPNPNCSNPAQDVGNYGKFSVSWTGDGAIDNRRRLSGWLDPLGTAPIVLDGKAASFITGPATLCTSETYTLTNIPTGATVTSWSATPSWLVSISGSGNSRTVTRLGNYNGSVTLTATIATGCGNVAINQDIFVGFPDIECLAYSNAIEPEVYYCPGEHVEAVTYLCSTHGDNKILIKTDSPHSQYEIQIRSYPSLNVIHTQTTMSKYVTLTYTPNVPAWYNIRVRAINHPCGTGPWHEDDIEYRDCNNPLLKGHWNVFPNPTSETLTVSLGSEADREAVLDKSVLPVFTATLYDNQDRQLRQGKSEDGVIQFDTRALPDGTYFLHIQHDGQVEKRQVLIRH